jgi:ubiquinone/menaquinone biosynthesis C-methylase UbiE
VKNEKSKVIMKNGEKEIFNKSKRVWEDNLNIFPESRLNFPDENLIRLMSGKYVSIAKPGAKILDHGFGHGNNLLYFANLGYECAGCEISNHLINEVQDLFEKTKQTADLRLIENLNIPFDDNSFDIVVSWNALHYNGTRKSVETVISELYRVLKKGGVLLLSTIHSKNGMCDRMKSVGDGSFFIESENEFDNRQGLTFFITKDEAELAGMFHQFSEVKKGNVYFDLFNYAERLSCSLIYAKK